MPVAINKASPFPWRSLQDPNLHSGVVSVIGTKTVELGIGHNQFVAHVMVKSALAADANAAPVVTWEFGSKPGTFVIACWKPTAAGTTTLITATAAVNVSFLVIVDSSVG